MKQTVPKPPPSWPAEITYINKPVYSKHLTSSELASLRRPTTTATSPTAVAAPASPPLTRIRIRTITNPTHPAHLQQGLFATHHLAPSTFILFYLGLIHSPLDSDSSSNYDLTLSRDHDLNIGIDASTHGNEARFINDYRGVPGRDGPNAEFRDVWVARGDGTEEKGIGVFVVSAGRAGKRGGGIAKGAEVLVSYGKGFWSARGENGT